MADLSDYRKSYEKGELSETDAPDNPIALFGDWFARAEISGTVDEANAMTVSAISPDGYPRARVVLLKEFTNDGFVFYTNYESEKGMAIAANNKVCLSFFWPALEQQIIIKGNAEKVPGHKSDEYFNSRPKGSRLGAIVSPQSRIVPSREYLEDKLHLAENTDNIERPQHWGGYIVKPQQIEFWQGRANRLHDRVRYTLQNDGDWNKERLAP